jgi:hypothetical protein
MEAVSALFSLHQIGKQQNKDRKTSDYFLQAMKNSPMCISTWTKFLYEGSAQKGRLLLASAVFLDHIHHQWIWSIVLSL